MEQSLIKVEIGTERGFGIVFSIVFLIISLYPLTDGGTLVYSSLLVAIVLLTISYIKPSIFSKPNFWWHKFGMLLGSISAPIVMGLIYFLAVVPTGFILRAFKEDPLNVKVDKSKKSYWISRETPPQPMKDQF
jgi:hypothetical protein